MGAIFKVGDKVRIRPRTYSMEYYRFGFLDHMAEHAGEIHTIVSVDPCCYELPMPIPDDNRGYVLDKMINCKWSSGMLEPVLTNKKRKHIKLNFNL